MTITSFPPRHVRRFAAPEQRRIVPPGRTFAARTGPLASELARPYRGNADTGGAVCGCGAGPARTVGHGWRWVAMTGTRTDVLSQPRSERGRARPRSPAAF